MVGMIRLSRVASWRWLLSVFYRLPTEGCARGGKF
jgi:hypothetical protein